MARRAEVGDQFLLSLEDSPESLEELFGGPLAQFCWVRCRHCSDYKAWGAIAITKLGEQVAITKLGE